MLELKSDVLCCEVVPELGGCIAGLWMGEHPVLRSTPAGSLETARRAGSYPLVPFSNRIGHATLVWQGTQHPLARTEGDEPHAIHGVGWQRKWDVLDSDELHAVLMYEHAPDSSWPFGFDCTQTLRLDGDTLELTLALTSHAPQPAPAGLGWHPYFMKRPRSRLAFSATGRWEMGADKLPTVRKGSRGIDADCGFLDVDHCYDGWDGVAHLRDEAMHVRVTSSLSRLVVFTNDTRDYIAIEPVSHVNNAVNRHAKGESAEELGLSILKSGESLMARMAIQVEPAR
jgi:aldose 1-epimerase